MSDYFLEKIKKEIEGLETLSQTENVGQVVAVYDGIVEIDGLENVLSSEMVIFDTNPDASLEDSLNNKNVLVGLVLNLNEDVVRAVVLGDPASIKEGTIVKSTGKVLSIPVGEELIGRVIDPLANPIDGRGNIATEEERPIESPAFSVIDRSPVNTPLHTGIKAIDSMVPIGRGQRELIIGDRFTGKTTIAIDTIINQLNEKQEDRPVCIYVAIGQKDSKTARIVSELEKVGAMKYTIVLSASSSSASALQFLAPYSGVSIAEYFMLKGKDALIIYDDLSKHAVAYRQMSLLLRRPPGREAYPGDIFYLHSRLLERSAKVSERLGGGSITALPIIETQEGDVSAYIPTNVISITDGQIFLSTDLFNKGVKPAIDAGLSVSRVGSAAQTKAIKKVSGKVRLSLAQFRELEAFMQFSGDLDKDTKQKLEKGKRMVQILIQKNREPMSFDRQSVVFYMVNKGFFDGFEEREVVEKEKEILEFMERNYSDIFKDISQSKTLSEETEKKIDEAFEAFQKI